MSRRNNHRLCKACRRRYFGSSLVCQCGARHCLACLSLVGSNNARQLCEDCAICQNCNRQQLRGLSPCTATYSFEVKRYQRNTEYFTNVNRKKFILQRVEPTQEFVFLCGQCYQVAGGDASTLGATFVWPAFIWSILKRHDLYKSGWKLLPITWRQWWETSFKRYHNLQNEHWLQEHSSFADVTSDYMDDIRALKENRWVHLMGRETSLVLPTIRCPAGCSEYKHKCKEMPMDIVFEICLDAPLEYLYSSKDYRAVRGIFRKDYLLRPVPILHNPSWLCMPSICVTENQYPTVLCCRYHDTLSKQQMIHAPTNPTGAICGQEAGNLSPVVPVPRTIKRAKMSAYSASFQMAALSGNYQGLDTMYLKSDKGITSQNCSLSWKQDVLSYLGRSDVRSYTQRQYKRYWNLQGCTAASIHRDASTMFQQLQSIREEHLLGSTYVGLEDAVNLQHSSNFDLPEIAYARDEDGTEEMIRFNPPYPRFLVWNHPTNCKYGANPPIIPNFKCVQDYDIKSSWLLSTAVLLVPELWNIVASANEKKCWSWECHVLAFLTTKHLPHISISSRGPHVKKGISANDLVKEYLVPISQSTNGYNAVGLTQMFTNRTPPFERMLCTMNNLPDIAPETSTRVLVVIRDYTSMNNEDLAWIPPYLFSYPNDKRTWKLCYIAGTEPNPRS